MKTKKKTARWLKFIQEKLPVVFSKLIVFLGIAFFALLFVFTLTTTFTYLDYMQAKFRIDHNILQILLGLIVFVVLLCLKPVKKLFTHTDAKKLARMAFVWGICVSVAWIFIANVRPMWDSEDLVYASDFLFGERNEATISKWIGNGAYLSRFPFNTSIVMVLSACRLVAGENQIILFELLSCLACAFAMYLTVKLTDALFSDKYATGLSAILVMLFLPIVLYCTFIYGNILSLPFILGAFILQHKAIEQSQDKHSFRKNFILSMLCFALAVFFKSTMLLPGIAMLAIWIVWATKEKRLLFLPILLVAFLVAKSIILPFNLIFEHFGSGLVNLHNGTPSIAWVAMGIGASKEYYNDSLGGSVDTEGTRYPGFFDGFVWTAADESYSASEMSGLSRSYILQRAKHFLKKPSFAFRYFANKLTIEWTEPTYEGFLASNWCRQDMSYIACERDYTLFAPYVYYGKAHSALVYWMDLQQTILAAGCLAALIIFRKKLKLAQLGIVVCVIGMAFVYIFWENKSQYIFPIYLFMIPFASYGFSLLSAKVEKIITRKK